MGDLTPRNWETTQVTVERLIKLLRTLQQKLSRPEATYPTTDSQTDLHDPPRLTVPTLAGRLLGPLCNGQASPMNPNGARPPPHPELPSQRFHGLLNSLFKVLFTFPSRYLSAIGLAPVFSLGWSLPPAWGCNPKQPDSTSTNPRPAAPGFLALRGSHPLRHAVPSRLRARTVEQWTGTVRLSRPQFAGQ